MEDAPLFNEKQSIRETARSLKKYGSTCNHFKRPELLLKYYILKTDTLQGIALKYGVTTEQIRRVNRLFASDSLFLREHLLIPITKESPHYDPNDENIIESRITQRASICTMQSLPDNAITPTTPEDQTCMDDFLDKVDTAIAMTKKYVKQRQDSLDFIDSPTNGISGMMRHSQSNHGSRHQSSSTSSGSAHDLHSNLSSGLPHTQVVMTQGRKVRTSLQRLQQQQDEMFEL